MTRPPKTQDGEGPAFDPRDTDALEAALAALSTAEEPLSDGFRMQLLEDAARITQPERRSLWSRLPEMLGLAGLPAAALAGAWLGLANPVLVLEGTPWGSTMENTDGVDTVLIETFGESWSVLEEPE